MLQTLLLGLILSIPLTTYAEHTDESFGYDDENTSFLVQSENKATVSSSVQSSVPGERFEKFNEALDRLGIPNEPRPDALSLLPPKNSTNLNAFITNLNLVDRFKAIQQYLHLDGTSLTLYNDFYKPGTNNPNLEYSTTLRTGSTSLENSTLLSRIRTISKQINSPSFAQHPLAGLKVAIDPGHMGSEYWDGKTGKFVKTTLNGSKEIKVSEGVINLHTALLLAGELEALGAQVLVTRQNTESVTHATIENYDRRPYENNYIYGGFDSWMSSFYTLAIDLFTQKLKDNIDALHAQPNKMVEKFFIAGEDLNARMRLINEFNPDIMLDIHYDASKSTPYDGQFNEVKSYVPGAFLNTTQAAQLNATRESGARISRALALNHLLEPSRWNASVNLASSIIKSMSLKTGIAARKLESVGTTKIRDGVFARNLYMTLHSVKGLTVYLECMRYDQQMEFLKLSNLDRSGNYNGISFKYSSRLDDVVDGIKTGIINYFATRKY